MTRLAIINISVVLIIHALCVEVYLFVVVLTTRV